MRYPTGAAIRVTAATTARTAPRSTTGGRGVLLAGAGMLILSLGGRDQPTLHRVCGRFKGAVLYPIACACWPPGSLERVCLRPPLASSSRP